MKKLLSVLATLGLTTTAVTSVVGCGSANSKTIVDGNLFRLDNVFKVKTVHIDLNDSEDEIIAKLLQANNVDAEKFKDNTTVEFMQDKSSFTIAPALNSQVYVGDPITITVSINVASLGIVSAFNTDGLDLDDSEQILNLIKSKTSNQVIDWTALTINKTSDYSLIVQPLATSPKYYGEFKITVNHRQLLADVFSTKLVQVNLNDSEDEIITRLLQANNLDVVTFRTNTSYQLAPDHSNLTITPQVDSKIYYGPALKITISIKVASLGIISFINRDELDLEDYSQVINLIKEKTTNQAIDWTALMFSKSDDHSILIEPVKNSTKYYGEFKITVNKRSLLEDAFKVKTIEINFADQEPTIIKKFLQANNIDENTFKENTTYRFNNNYSVLLISPTTDSKAYYGSEIKIIISINVASLDIVDEIDSDQADFDLSPTTIDLIKEKTTNKTIDWNLLTFKLVERAFIVEPIANNTQYSGQTIIKYNQKTKLADLFKETNIKVKASDEPAEIVNQALLANAVDPVVFYDNATFSFSQEQQQLTITAKDDSRIYARGSIAITYSIAISSLGIVSTINGDEIVDKEPTEVLSFIEAKTNKQSIDWTALTIDKVADSFVIKPLNNKYAGELKISLRQRQLLTDLFKKQDLTASKNASKNDVLAQLASENGLTVDQFQDEVEVGAYQYANDFSITITPKIESTKYYGPTIKIIVRKDVNDLGISPLVELNDLFGRNDSYGWQAAFNYVKNRNKTLSNINWDNLQVVQTELKDNSTILSAKITPTNQQYSGQMKIKNIFPYATFDGFKVENTEKVKADLAWKNSGIDWDYYDIKVIDNKTIHLFLKANKDDFIPVSYFERVDLATRIRNTEIAMPSLNPWPSDKEIVGAVAQANNFSEEEKAALLAGTISVNRFGEDSTGKINVQISHIIPIWGIERQNPKFFGSVMIKLTGPSKE